jgi:peptidoglycan biosynthesis protein MviN/MurJ (putative lipid II flippase)
VTNIVQLLLRIAICALFLDRLGVAVIPIAYTVSSTVEAVVLYAIVSRRIQHWTPIVGA